MAVNVIAKVEGGGAWDAINYNDPITIGLMQWYGSRAAKLLLAIEEDHPVEYQDIDSSIRASLQGHGASSWWTTRYLTRAEGNTIKPVLRASHDTQGAMVGSDVEDYKAAAGRIGLNADTNTDTTIFFMCMYHQSPQRAINLMKLIGMGSDLKRTYQSCLNEAVFSRYRTRYTQAYNYIKSGVPPEIIDLNDDNEPGGDGSTGGAGPDADDGGGSIFDKVKSGISRIEVAGDVLLVHLADDKVVEAVPTGGNNFLLAATYKGEDVDPSTPEGGESDDDYTPDPDASTTQQKLVDFMVSRIGKYGYSQGPGRLKPDQSGVADCSSIIRYAYLTVTGKDVGTYTDAQVTNGSTRVIQTGGGGDIPTKMEPGDLIIMARGNEAPGRFASHVEMYMGNDKTIGHGGPMKGPIIKSMSANVRPKTRWWLKRLKSL